MSSRAARLWQASALLWLGLCARTPSARAYEEQASVDLAAGYVNVTGKDRAWGQAPWLSLGVAVGVSDLFMLRGSASYGLFIDKQEVRHTLSTRAEAAYLIDVLQWVPFFGVGGGVWMRDGFGDNRFDAYPAGHLLVGLDYLLSRSWIVGVDARPGIMLQPDGAVGTFDVQLRFSRIYQLF